LVIFTRLKLKNGLILIADIGSLLGFYVLEQLKYPGLGANVHFYIFSPTKLEKNQKFPQKLFGKLAILDFSMNNIQLDLSDKQSTE